IASLHWVEARSQSHVPAHGPNAKPATGTSLSALVATIEQGDDAKAELAIGALRNAGAAGLDALLAAYDSVAEATNDPRRIRIRSRGAAEGCRRVPSLLVHRSGVSQASR